MADPPDLGPLLDSLEGIITEAELGELRLLADALDETILALPEDEEAREREFAAHRTRGEDHPYEVALGRLFARFGSVMARHFPHNAEAWLSDPVKEIGRIVADADERTVARALQRLDEDV
jgi:hypothetical protein